MHKSPPPSTAQQKLTTNRGEAVGVFGVGGGGHAREKARQRAARKHVGGGRGGGGGRHDGHIPATRMEAQSKKVSWRHRGGRGETHVRRPPVGAPES